MDAFIEKQATEYLTSLTIEILKKSGKKMFGWVKEDYKSIKQKYYLGSGKYIKKFRERHGKVKVLGMRSPIEVQSIYTEVKIYKDISSYKFKSVKEIEQHFRRKQKRGFQSNRIGKVDGLRVASDTKFLMILGGPGVGKSTFLKRIGIECLMGRENKYAQDVIPVFLELKKINSFEFDIVDAIIEEFKICGFPYAKDFVIEALIQGKLLILFDGLDEIPTKYSDKTITMIQDFIDQYDQNRCITTCRIAAYKGGFSRFKDFEMADFDDGQIELFISKWFGADIDKKMNTAVKCWDTLKMPEYVAAKELAHTPLLLTLLCLVFDYSQDFPKNRSILYREALDILLKTWAAEKRIQRDPIYKDLNIALEEVMLSEIAYKGFVNDQLFFTKNELSDQIKDFLYNNLNAPNHLDGESILEAIAIQQGVLVERAKNVYTFSHLTLQEFLTAKYIDDNWLIDDLVTEHLGDPRWREVFLLISGLLRSGADRLLQSMEIKANKNKLNTEISILFKWIENSVNESSDYKSLTNQKLVLLILVSSYVFNNSNFVRDILRICYKVDHELGQMLDGSYIADCNLDYELHRQLAIELIEYLESREIISFPSLIPAIRNGNKREIANTFGLPPELLGYKYIDGLEIYLEIFTSIFECKQAAIRVSRDIWEKIITRMLVLSK